MILRASKKHIRIILGISQKEDAHKIDIKKE
jgi:DNA-binding XRE family transcriptional regulator